MRAAVFAVEDTAAQVVWPAAEPGSHVVAAGGIEVRVETDGGPGAADIGGLTPATAYELRVDGRRAASFRTLASPPGALLSRFATVSDSHVGEEAFGVLRRMTDATPSSRPYPERCLAAALDQARAWGATHVVAKGDITDFNRASELETVARLLTESGMGVSALLGNHDVTRRGVPAQPFLRSLGVDVPDEPHAVDLPGIRIVHVPTAVSGRSRGHIPQERREAACTLAAEAGGPVFVALHHSLQRLPFQVTWPPGVPGPEARALLDELRRANPNAIVSSGHSHRNRRRTHGSVVVTEVGSTKDYPGGWAGYAVHEGGIRQVVRRTTGADVLAWTDYTRRALGGVWPLWSTGLRRWRCFTHRWPVPGRLGVPSSR